MKMPIKSILATTILSGILLLNLDHLVSIVEDGLILGSILISECIALIFLGLSMFCVAWFLRDFLK
jgi:hypothetical protein